MEFQIRRNEVGGENEKILLDLMLVIRKHIERMGLFLKAGEVIEAIL